MANCGVDGMIRQHFQILTDSTRDSDGEAKVLSHLIGHNASHLVHHTSSHWCRSTIHRIWTKKCSPRNVESLERKEEAARRFHKKISPTKSSVKAHNLEAPHLVWVLIIKKIAVEKRSQCTYVAFGVQLELVVSNFTVNHITATLIYWSYSVSVYPRESNGKGKYLGAAGRTRDDMTINLKVSHHAIPETKMS